MYNYNTVIDIGFDSSAILYSKCLAWRSLERYVQAIYIVPIAYCPLNIHAIQPEILTNAVNKRQTTDNDTLEPCDKDIKLSIRAVTKFSYNFCLRHQYEFSARIT